MNGFMVYTAVIGLTICAAVGIIAVIAWLAEQFAGDDDELWPDEDWSDVALKSSDITAEKIDTGAINGGRERG